MTPNRSLSSRAAIHALEEGGCTAGTRPPTTAEVDTPDLCRILWLLARTKPKTVVVLFGAKTYKEMYLKFRAAAARMKGAMGEESWLSLLRHLMPMSAEKIKDVAARTGFKDEWLATKRKGTKAVAEEAQSTFRSQQLRLCRDAGSDASGGTQRGTEECSVHASMAMEAVSPPASWKPSSGACYDAGKTMSMHGMTVRARQLRASLQGMTMARRSFQHVRQQLLG